MTDEQLVTGFQYISCYSLSEDGIEVKRQGEFQYISCYSLSFPELGVKLSSLRFNTSHVTLYRKFS